MVALFCIAVEADIGTCGFFATVTKELLRGRVFETRAQAYAELFEFIEIRYNRRRRHSALDYCTPVEFEERLRKIN